MSLDQGAKKHQGFQDVLLHPRPRPSQKTMRNYHSPMARKASLEIKEVILMVFAAIIMVSVSGLWSELYAAVYTQPDDGSIANFNRLYAAFEGMLPKADQTAQSQPTDTIKDKDLINFYLGPGKAVVFFDTDWDNKANAVEKQQAWYQFFGG